MKCIYCRHDTKVTNSRTRSLNSSIWRRRQCLSCVAQFSTNELPEFHTALVVKTLSNQLSPFSRDKLFLSVYKALGHRKDALDSATELTQTITGLMLRGKNYINSGSIDIENLAKITYMTLKRFDSMSANTYKAYHSVLLKK